MPLLSFELQPSTPREASPPITDGPHKKHWMVYIPTFGTVVFLLSPHPSLLKVLISFYLIDQKATSQFFVHLAVIYFLTFVAFTSLIVLLVRDPGPVDPSKAQMEEDERLGFGQTTRVTVEDSDEEEVEGSISLNEMLLGGQPGTPKGSGARRWAGNGEKRWCQKCWAPKPERCHHCSVCGRCVLKMDHHCPWLASKCIGHRTYATFVHFLLSITLLSIYGFLIMIPPIRHYLDFTTIINPNNFTPFHVVFIALEGLIFSFTVGSFWIYHVYLISTNQTTLESLAPYLLLRHIPSQSLGQPTPSPRSLSAIRKTPENESGGGESPYFFPPPPAEQELFTPSILNVASSTPSRLVEHELTGDQRRLIRRAAGKIKIYDLGWKRNWKEVLGGTSKRTQSWKWWLRFVFTGGVSDGDGYRFDFNPEAEGKLDKLAAKLHTMR